MSERGPIVCATDLSTTGAEAVELAARLAAATDRPLHVVHVTGATPGLVESEPRDEAERVYQERLKRRLEAAEEGLERARETAAGLGPRAESALLSGRPWERLVEYAEKVEASLICVGPHGHSGPRRTQRRGLTEWILGSTADRVLRHAGCPVLVGSRHEEHTAPIQGDTWLVAIDFSDQSKAALALARELSAACGASLVALHVIADPLAQLDPTGEEEPFPPIPGLREAATERKLAELRTFLKDVAADGIDARIEIGEPSYEIAVVANELSARMVLMGTHGRTGLSRLLFGSTAERTLRRCGAPVLCVST